MTRLPDRSAYGTTERSVVVCCPQFRPRTVTGYGPLRTSGAVSDGIAARTPW
jgi:hypothetical protein